MKTDYFRASSINTYADCQFKYFLNYSLGIPSKAGKKAELGTICHLVLEILAKAKKNGRKMFDSKFTTPIYLLDCVLKRWKQKFPEFGFDDKDREFCRDQIRFVLQSKFNPMSLDVIKVEHQFQLKLNLHGFPEGFELRGTMDLVTKENNDTIHIIDYKTGQRTDWITGEPKELKDFFKDNQLKFYALVCRLLYPNYKYYMFTIIFTRDGGPFTVTFERQELENMLNWLRQLQAEVKFNSKPTRLKDLRGNQIWKCNNVCQFGIFESLYADDEGNLFILEHKPNKLKPTMEIGGKKYTNLGIPPLRVCDKYYDILKTQGIKTASDIIVNLSISASTKLSPRNNYDNPKITKGIIDEESIKNL